MKTAPGKPHSTHVSHKAHEGAVTEPPRSAYAPKQAHQRAGTEHYPVENDRDPLRSPNAPKQARTARYSGDDTRRASRGLREHTARYAHDAAHPNMGRHEQPAAEHRDERMSDRDIEQLEASLRLLQRQESATRSPRAAHLASVPGLAPVDASGRRGERVGDGFRSPRSLEPERLPPPPKMPRRNIGAPVGIVVAIILVATIAYYFAVGGWAPSSAPEPQTASDPTAPSSWSTGKQATWPTMEDDNRATSAQSDISQPARSSEGEAGERGAQVRLRTKAPVCLSGKGSSYS
jgi:hypothetical protein